MNSDVSGIIRFNPKVLLTDGTHEFWVVVISLDANRENGIGTYLLPPYD